MTAEALGSEEEIKRRDDKDKGEKAEEDKIPLAREGAVSIHAPPQTVRKLTIFSGLGLQSTHFFAI